MKPSPSRSSSMISSGGSRKVATFCPYWYLLVLYPSAGIGLVQPFAPLGRAERFSCAGPRWQGRWQSGKQGRARLYRCPFPLQLDRQAIQHILRLTISLLMLQPLLMLHLYWCYTFADAYISIDATPFTDATSLQVLHLC